MAMIERDKTPDDDLQTREQMLLALKPKEKSIDREAEEAARRDARKIKRIAQAIRNQS